MEESKPFNKDLIGKKAVKKRGFMSGVVGIVEVNKFKITPYTLNISSHKVKAHLNEDDFEVLAEQ